MRPPSRRSTRRKIVETIEIAAPPELNDENSEKGVRAWVHASLENLKAKVEKGSL